MSFYRKHIYSRVMTRTLTQPGISECRRQHLADVHGDILEIGIGTGLNLPHYPDDVERITAVDLGRELFEWAEQFIRESGVQVDFHTGQAEDLPFADESFDAVVSSWTLCSVVSMTDSLAEIHRVLRPGGQYWFLEHGKSPDRWVGRLQSVLTPLIKQIGDGCHLDRDFEEAIHASELQIRQIERFYLDKGPKIAGYMYRGVAVK